MQGLDESWPTPYTHTLPFSKDVLTAYVTISFLHYGDVCQHILDIFRVYIPDIKRKVVPVLK
jgi:hypothetical protein